MTHRHDQHPETKDTSARTPQREALQPDAPDLARLSLSDAAGLQHLAGNRAVSALIAQRRMASEPRPSPDEVTPEDIGQVVRGPGKPLAEPILRRAEGATGMPMSHVRVHTGAAAAASAAALQARAYTFGSDIVVGKDGADEETLLHETKHIEQQARGAVPGRTTAGGVQLSSPDDAAEREAATFAADQMRHPAPAPAAAVGEHHHPGDGHDHGSVQRTLEGGTQAESSAMGARRGNADDIEEYSDSDHEDDEVTEPVALSRQISPEGATDPRYKLSNLMARNTIVQPGKPSRWDYYIDKWHLRSEYKAERNRLRKILERRVVKGKPFSAEELSEIRRLSADDPEWLRVTGIGTYQDAERLAQGADADKFATWMRKEPGQRILAATIAFERHRQAEGEPTPIDPAYTLGRFMTTQGMGKKDPGRAPLEDERDAQIRKTAVDTMYPQGLDASELHSNQSQVSQNDRARAAEAGGILANVLHVLQAGLEVREEAVFKKTEDSEETEVVGFYKKYEGDVIRALAHGGRVLIRVPALTSGADPNALLNYLGVTQNGVRAGVVDRRGGATHHTDIEKNKDGKPGQFKERGGGKAGIRNAATHGLGYLGEEAANLATGLVNTTPGDRGPTKLMGVNPAIGGVGGKDWNGDVILPNGSYGHMLLVWQPPTGDKDGSLLVGIETVAMNKPSPVGYKHTATSTEATANPESSLHGHKADKIGVGATKDNTRLVDLRDVKRDDRGWLEVLNDIKATWDSDMAAAAGNAGAERALYEQLVGPRRDR